MKSLGYSHASLRGQAGGSSAAGWPGTDPLPMIAGYRRGRGKGIIYSWKNQERQAGATSFSRTPGGKA